MSRIVTPARLPISKRSLDERVWQWWVDLDDIRQVVGTEVHVGPVIASGSRILKLKFEMVKPFALALFDVEVNIGLVAGDAETRADVEAGVQIVPWFWSKTGFVWHPKDIDAKEEFELGMEIEGAELRPAIAISTTSVEPVFWQIGVLWALP